MRLVGDSDSLKRNTACQSMSQSPMFLRMTDKEQSCFNSEAKTNAGAPGEQEWQSNKSSIT